MDKGYNSSVICGSVKKYHFSALSITLLWSENQMKLKDFKLLKDLITSHYKQISTAWRSKATMLHIKEQYVSDDQLRAWLLY